MRLGATEILLILVIALVVFGSNKLSGVGKAVGTSIREFKQEMKSTENKDGEKSAGETASK
ncbi:MAG: twin-arginine translocase TatA/TatE family subunit [Acidaminococcaceae bacterium]